MRGIEQRNGCIYYYPVCLSCVHADGSAVCVADTRIKTVKIKGGQPSHEWRGCPLKLKVIQFQLE